MKHEGHYPIEGVQLNCQDERTLSAVINTDSISASELMAKLDTKLIYELMNQALSNQLTSKEDELEGVEDHTLR